MNNKLTINLISYNSAKYLPFCLPSLFNQTFKNWQLVVLDNNSPDNSLEIAKKYCAGKSNVRFLISDKNLGFAGGNNLIIKKTTSDYVMLLNPDTIMEPDYIEKLVDFLDKNKDTGAVIGKILRWNPSFDNSKQLKLTNSGKTDKIDTAGLVIKPTFNVSELGAGQVDRGDFNVNQRIFGVSGCLPIYKRSALEEVGFFDKKFFNYKEDVNLAFRLYYKNYSSYRIGGAVAYHDRTLDKTKNRKKRSQFLNYLSYRNHLFVLIKNLATIDFIRYGIFILFYEFKKLVYLILFEQKTLYAWIEVIKNLKYLIKQRKKIKQKSVKLWIK